MSRARVLSPIFVLAAQVSACTSTFDVDQPGIFSTSKSRIIIGEPSSSTMTSSTVRARTISGYADNAPFKALTFGAADGDRVTLFYLPLPLEQYFLTPGLLAPADRAPARSIPHTAEIYQGTVQGTSLAFSKVDKVDPFFFQVRFPTADALSCVLDIPDKEKSKSHCLVFDDTENIPSCEAPCTFAQPIPAGSAEPVSIEASTFSSGCSDCSPMLDPQQRVMNDCQSGQAQLFGRAACEHIGRPCPGTEFPAVPAELASIDSACVLYVRASGASSPCSLPTTTCGSLGLPCASIKDALDCSNASCPSGRVFLLGAENYRVSSEGVSAANLIGLCPERTTISGHIEFTGGSNRIQGVRILAFPGRGGQAAFAGNGSEVELSILETVITTATITGGHGLIGIAVSGSGTIRTGTIAIEHAGVGLLALAGAKVTIDNTLIQDTSSIALSIAGPTPQSAMLRRLLIRDATAAAGTSVDGLRLTGGASAVIDQASIEGMRSYSVRVEGAGTTLSGSLLAIRDMAPLVYEGRAGIGVFGGGSFSIERAIVDSPMPTAIFVDGAGSSATLSSADLTGPQTGAVDGVVVARASDQGSVAISLANVTGGFGDIIDVDNGHATLDRVDVKMNGRYAKACDTVSLHAKNHGRLEATSTNFDAEECQGLVAESGATVSLKNVLFKGTVEDPTLMVDAPALTLAGGSTVTLDSVQVESHGSPLISLQDASTKGRLANVLLCEISGKPGPALNVESGAALDADRLQVFDDLVVSNMSTTATIKNLTIDHTMPCSGGQVLERATFVRAETEAFLKIQAARLKSASIDISGSATATIADVTIGPMGETPEIAVKTGSLLSLNRASLAGGFPGALQISSPEMGGTPPVVDVHDLDIEDNTDRVESSGVDVSQGALTRITRFKIDEDPKSLLFRYGVRVFDGSRLVLVDGSFLTSGVDICVSGSDFEPHDLLNQVTFVKAPVIRQDLCQ